MSAAWFWARGRHSAGPEDQRHLTTLLGGGK
jgi:hypothetical protein